MTVQKFYKLIPRVFQFSEWQDDVVYKRSTSQKYRIIREIKNKELVIKLRHIPSIGYGIPFKN